ncbi:MAG TPA: YggT family protein [bacterium]
MIYLVQFVNYTLALGMWLILGRAALGVLTGGRPTPLQALFDRFTAPFFALTRRALPFVGEKGAPLAAFFLLALLRVALIVLAHPAAGR